MAIETRGFRLSRFPGINVDMRVQGNTLSGLGRGIGQGLQALGQQRREGQQKAELEALRKADEEAQDRIAGATLDYLTAGTEEERKTILEGLEDPTERFAVYTEGERTRAAQAKTLADEAFGGAVRGYLEADTDEAKKAIVDSIPAGLEDDFFETVSVIEGRRARLGGGDFVQSEVDPNKFILGDKVYNKVQNEDGTISLMPERSNILTPGDISTREIAKEAGQLSINIADYQNEDGTYDTKRLNEDINKALTEREKAKTVGREQGKEKGTPSYELTDEEIAQAAMSDDPEIIRLTNAYNGAQLLGQQLLMAKSAQRIREMLEGKEPMEDKEDAGDTEEVTKGGIKIKFSR